MRLREMFVTVSHEFMPMRMTMPINGRKTGLVRMLMVFVVNMLVRALGHLMGMKMPVAFGQVQAYAKRHRQSGKDQCRRHRLARQGRSQCGTKKWRD